MGSRVNTADAAHTRGAPAGHESGLAARFLAHARRAPHATALVWRDQEIDYGTLLDRVREQRARLRATPGDAPVAALAVKSPATVALVLACLLERRTVLLPSATLGADALERLCAEARVGEVLDAAADVPPTRHPVPTGAQEQPAAPTGRPALLLTTSGSTGAPKIVPLGVEGVDAFVRWAADAFGIGPGTTVLNYAPLNFDLCLLDVWTTLAHGGRVVLVDAEQALNGPRLLDLLDAHRPQVVQGVPLLHRLLIDAARDTGRTLEYVRHAVFTGDALPGPLLARLPHLMPAARLYNIYGCTETNDSFWYEVRDARTESGAPLPLGRPLPGVEHYLADAQGRVVEGAGTGELLVSTPFQTDGYLGAAAAAPVFAPPPPDGGARRYFRTGDLVRRHPDGTLTLEGRTDHQVKVRGVRVNAQEVESVLLAHPHVTEAAVLALPDAGAGHLLHAVVRRAAGSGLHSLTLRGHLARRLPRAAVPSALRLTDDPLPRTSTGKVDRGLAVRATLTKEN
ncbi:AMP-binding protein [Streptomyces sp. NY05-11A]|uniref:AMP-binding protein n=1 Tax=Streptomyces soliscabiei TaxID=588897 RepID=UPI0029AE50B6|nr:AMP-binding protein [Streptomyces sp. NY05-11A]MDX2680451.1 AMP-binding protein [Streptomyces sp. NY05-11A]